MFFSGLHKIAHYPPPVLWDVGAFTCSMFKVMNVQLIFDRAILSETGKASNRRGHVTMLATPILFCVLFSPG